MYHKIIVALALDHGISQTALQVARALRTEGGEIIALHAYEPVQGSVRAYLGEEVIEGAYKRAQALLAERVAGEPDIRAVMLRGHSGRAITDYAEGIGADCIVVGSHKPGLSDFFLGSTAARVVRHAVCAVHVLR
ncbi:Nucleotide-binding universal stress protein, UspA family [Roseovarius azorensis]|uniref:Nucleotide-binding universal stress protein, UspA family n=1 Tax=Roseovarius azorensis TaxID=1287727 RepID=A0A1H7R5J3_9RHOB|nr:universal stress protein [Roseovarius azorensis]SEL55501.1 Nucleotide-binding universal stress protein, UspA family [Roseovarius azorensis]